MTALIFSYCFLGCCALNSYMKTPPVSLVIKFSWIFLSLAYLVGIAAFAMASSQTIFLNIKIFFKLQKFQISICDRKITPLRRNIVHLDLVNEYKTLLYSTCFRISTKTILDNRLWLFQISRYLFMIYFKIAYKY